MLSALEHFLDRPLEIFIVRRSPEADTEPLLSRFRQTYLPNRIFVSTTEGEDLQSLTQLVPALGGKGATQGEVTAFVCEEGACELPTSQPAVFEKQLSKIEPFPGPLSK
jgi:uncharacterized protein YyaL (SSP411 family)